jgi:hypothetical protein
MIINYSDSKYTAFNIKLFQLWREQWNIPYRTFLYTPGSGSRDKSGFAKNVLNRLPGTGSVIQIHGSADPDPVKHNYRSGTMLTPKMNKIAQRRGKTETDSGDSFKL